VVLCQALSGDDGVGVEVGQRLGHPARAEGPAVVSEDRREGELLQAGGLAAGRFIAGLHRHLEFAAARRAIVFIDIAPDCLRIGGIAYNTIQTDPTKTLPTSLVGTFKRILNHANCFL
jgi:hypothetical protein